AKLSKGTKVPQIKNNLVDIDKKGWFYVEYEKEKYGWISSSFSKKIIDSSIEVNKQTKLTNKVPEKDKAHKVDQIKPDKPSKVFTTNKPTLGTKGKEILHVKEFKNLKAKSSKEITTLQLTIKSLRTKLNEVKLDKVGAIEARNFARGKLQIAKTESINKVKHLESITASLRSELAQIKLEKEKSIKTNNTLRDKIKRTIFDNDKSFDALTTTFASLRSELAQIKSDKTTSIEKIKNENTKINNEKLARAKEFENLKEKSSKAIRSLQTTTETLRAELNQIKSNKANLIENVNKANDKANEEKLAFIKEFENLKEKS
ncbi:uncharacterized protein METZ01_LOCUS355541, partial [marine metagenome]